MKPEIQWRLYVKDSERFHRNPFKGEVKLAFACGSFASIVIIHTIRFFWGF